ncbi:MAG: TlpA family protein disulfide reductase [Acidobacteria bacterium]|nr:TlpA family protein disulfide reductase [Acidobacteriota bacterium]
MMHRRSFLATGLGAGATLASLPLAAQIKTPKPAPELVTTLNSGEQLLLSKFRGKVVLIEFLLTTCPHCQDCSRTMQKVYADLGDKFQPLGIAVNPDNMQQARMLIPQYSYSLGLRFPVGYTNRDMAYQWLEAKMDGPIYFPQVVFIDRKGIIRHHFPGGHDFYKDEENNMRKVLASLIDEGAAAKPAASKKS